MPIDTLFVTDTIVIHDTILKISEKCATNSTENVEVYKELLHSQSQTYSLMIYVFIGIIALFAGATWLYNKKIAQSEIKKETKKIFDEEKGKMMMEFKKEFDKEICFTKGESARLFANSIKNSTVPHLTNKFYWWIVAIKNYVKADISQGVRLSTDNAIIAAEAAIKEQKGCKEYIDDNYSDVDFLKIIENIPDILNDEKKELKKLTIQLLASKNK